MEKFHLGDILPKVRDRLIKQYGQALLNSDREGDQEIRSAIAREVKALHKTADQELIDEVAAYLIGLGPIEKYLKDPEVSEIMVNSYNTIFIEKNGVIQKTDLSFSSEEELRNVADRIVQRCGRRVNFSSPLVDARLPDGSRVNVVVPPAAPNTVITIRRFVQLVFDTGALIKDNFISADMVDFLRTIIEGKANIVICGATGCGKTTFLRWLAGFILPEERVVTIEDTRELNLLHPHCIPLEASDKASIYDLMINSLRMRPDRIILGEVRGAEAFELLQAMGTGHEGSITTVHANYGKMEAIHRLVRAMSRIGDVSAEDLEAMVSETIDILIFVKRFPDGTRRVVHITQMESEHGKPVFHDIYKYSKAHDRHSLVGRVTPELVERILDNLQGQMPKHPAFNYLKPVEVAGN